MDKKEITTKRFLKKHRFHLLHNKIIVNQESPFASMEYEISYEEIPNNKLIETRVNYGLLVFSCFSFFVGLIFLFGDRLEGSLFFCCLSILLLILAFLTKLRLITITTFSERNLELYFNNSNKEDVLAFSESIIKSANNYLLSKYTRIDRDLPIDNQLHQLMNLRDRELLTDEKFEQLKNQLLGKEHKTSIGYKR